MSNPSPLYRPATRILVDLSQATTAFETAWDESTADDPKQDKKVVAAAINLRTAMHHMELMLEMLGLVRTADPKDK